MELEIMINYRDENIIEVAWTHFWLSSSELYPNEDFDSKDAKMEIIQIAEDFEKAYEGIDWDDGKHFYYEDIENYATDRLMKGNKGEE